ncbi:MAG: hypothetical protein EAY69_04490 [Cytophagales bacterium]|nr:MAG: hypothetical protein EAY69_04490 [Cytophagales bacterium]
MKHLKFSLCNLLFFLFFVNKSTLIFAQDVTIGVSGFGEPFCPGSLFQVTATANITNLNGWTASGSNGYAWTTDNATNSSLGSSAIVRFLDNTTKATIRLTVTFTKIENGQTVTKTVDADPRVCQVRSLTNVNPIPMIPNPVLVSNCANTVTLSIAQMKMPATDNTFADGYEWSVPAGWMPTSQLA